MAELVRGWGQVAAGLKEGDRILTAACEYAANYVAYLQVCRRTGAVVEVIPSLASGETSPAALEAMIDDRVKSVPTLRTQLTCDLTAGHRVSTAG